MVINEEKLADLRDLLGSDEFAEVMNIAIADIDQLLTTITAMLETRDEPGARRAVHKVRGFASQFFLPELEAAANATHFSTTTFPADETQEILNALQRASLALKQYRGDAAPLSS